MTTLCFQALARVTDIEADEWNALVTDAFGTTHATLRVVHKHLVSLISSRSFLYVNLAYYNTVREAPSLGIRASYNSNAKHYSRCRRACEIHGARIGLWPESSLLTAGIRLALRIRHTVFKRKLRIENDRLTGARK